MLCSPFSIKRAHEIRKFHVAIGQRQLRNVQKSVIYMQICGFANVNLFFFAVFMAVAIDPAKAPYCCDPEICFHGNMTSHFSSL